MLSAMLTRSQLIVILMLVSKLSLAQWPELQERYLTNVFKVETWYYNVYKGTITDSSLGNIRFYSKHRELIEYRYNYDEKTNDMMVDTSKYYAEEYSFDTLTRSKIRKFVDKLGPIQYCPSWTGHPRKKIEKANEKGQLTEVEIFDEESTPKDQRFLYFYDDADLLIQVKCYYAKEFKTLYKLKYTFY